MLPAQRTNFIPRNRKPF